MGRWMDRNGRNQRGAMAAMAGPYALRLVGNPDSGPGAGIPELRISPISLLAFTSCVALHSVGKNTPIKQYYLSIQIEGHSSKLKKLKD